MKRTYQPSNRKRIKKHGFRKRMSNSKGKKVLASRRKKGRKKLTVSIQLMKTKIVALKNNEDFKSLIKGNKLSNKYFVMFYKKLIKKNSNSLNISIITKKKLGSAIQRNFARRRLKNLINEIVKKISINFNYSYLIIAKDSSLKKNSFSDLKKTIFMSVLGQKIL